MERICDFGLAPTDCWTILPFFITTRVGMLATPKTCASSGSSSTLIFPTRYQWWYHAAWPAPVGIKIKKNRLIACFNRSKIVLIYIENWYMNYHPLFYYIFSIPCFYFSFCDEVTFFALHMSCVIVPIGQYTHHERGLNRIIVTNPRTVDVSITL